MLTIEEVSKRLRVSRNTVTQLIRDGKIQNVIKVGNQYRIPESSFNEYFRNASL